MTMEQCRVRVVQRAVLDKGAFLDNVNLFSEKNGIICRITSDLINGRISGLRKIPSPGLN